MSVLQRLFGGKKAQHDTVVRLYRGVVEQARQPQFYAVLGVPDTVEGRFDLLALHGFLVMEALSPDRPDLAQGLFDLMFDDMESNLRELGVSDIRIGARVKKLAQDFFGRSEAYRKALENKDDSALIDVLDRNVYAMAPTNPAHLATLASYVRRCRADPKTGQALFPQIETIP